MVATYGIRLLHESIHENSQQFISVIDLVRVLSDNPNQRGFGFRFIEFIEVGAQRRNNALVLRWVFPEDILKR